MQERNFVQNIGNSCCVLRKSNRLEKIWVLLFASALVENTVLYMPNTVIILGLHGFVGNIWGSGWVRGMREEQHFSWGVRGGINWVLPDKGSIYVVVVPVWHKSLAFCLSSVLQTREKITTNCYKFKIKDGSFITLRSRWFSFMNPWTKEVEYIVSTNTVVS